MVTGTDLRSREREVDSITRPDPRQHAEHILLWILCWPWNLLWTALVHNPVRHIVQFLIVELRATLEEISSGEFQEIERDLVISNTEPDRCETVDASAEKTVVVERSDTVAVVSPKPAVTMPVQASTPPPVTAAGPPPERPANSRPIYVPPPEPKHLTAPPAEPARPPQQKERHDPWLGTHDCQEGDTWHEMS